MVDNCSCKFLGLSASADRMQVEYSRGIFGDLDMLGVRKTTRFSGEVALLLSEEFEPSDNNPTKQTDGVGLETSFSCSSIVGKESKLRNMNVQSKV